MMSVATIVLGAVVTAGLLASGAATAGDKNPWVCTKDGKAMHVKGKSAGAKKKACEDKGGTWGKKDEATATDPAGSFGSSSGGGASGAGGGGGGGGGGW